MSEPLTREQLNDRLALETKIADERQNAYRVEQTLLAQQCDERWGAHREKHDLEAKALGLQAEEYERRLETLNHDHANTRNTQATYLPREIYAADQREWNGRVRVLEDFKNNLTGRLVIVGGIIAVAAALLGGLISRLVMQ